MNTATYGRGNPALAILVPACFLTAPFLAFLVHNVDAGVGALPVLRYPAVGIVPLAAGIAAVWFFISRTAAERMAVLLATMFIAIFNYGALSDALESTGTPTWMRLLVWLLVATLLAAIGFAWSRNRALILYLFIAGVIFVALPLVQYLALALREAPMPASVDTPTGPTFLSTPDIYYIVPDAYARADLLEDEFGFDNSEFLEELRKRGFRVEENALTSYPLTYLSMASTLDMDYVVEPAEDALRGGRGPFYDRLRGNSALHRRLEIEGYQHVSAPPGTWEGTQCSGQEDLCVDPVSRRWAGGLVGEVEWGLLHLTPAGEFIDGFLTDSFERPFADPSHVVRTVRQTDLGAPAFVQIHLLQSHPPFLFDRNCRATPSENQDLRSWPAAGRAAYVAALQCTNQQLLSAVDLMDDDAIVVILADHGPGFTLGLSTPFEEWTNETLRERYSVLSAYRLPTECRDMPPASPPNVFRVVVACLDGTEPKLIADRWFFAGYLDQEEVREMSEPPSQPSGSSHHVRP